MKPLIALALLVASQSLAQAGSLRAMVKEHRLKNGMVWLLVERPQAPVFTGFVRVKVGGADEQPGATGLAHLFEHMAFKGTPALGTSDFEKEKPLLVEIARVGDRLNDLKRSGQGGADEAKSLQQRLEQLNGQHKQLTDENALLKLYQLSGAVGLNATTNKDVTSYFVSLPKNRLETWLTIEASRLVSPVLRDFYTERDVVIEERRMSIESNPTGAAYEELMQVAFTSSPYRWPTVGYQQDLATMSLAEAHEFRARYYVPGNAVGCLVGDFKADEALALIEKTFGSIPAAPLPPEPRFTEPPARAQRRSTVTFDAAPRLYLAFRKAKAPSKDDDVFDLLSVILGDGRTGRLHQRLVLGDRLAQSVGVFGGPGDRLDNLFIVSVVPLKDVPQEKVEAAVWDELGKLSKEKVSARELERARNRVSADQARALDSNSGLASSLSFSQAVLGDWRYTADRQATLEKLTDEDLLDVSRRTFKKETSVLVDLARPSGAK